MAQDVKLNNSMKRKLQKQSDAALGNMHNTREKEEQKYMPKCVFPLSIECVDLQENRIWRYDQPKRRYNSQRKNSLLFIKFCKKNKIC